MILLSQDFWEMKDSGKKGRGIFVKKDISAGTVIGDYIGKVIREKEEDEYDNGKHYYLMYYSDNASIYPNPRKPGVHIINHSCTPNTWMYTYYGHTLYFAVRHIFAGEELTVSYLMSEQDEDCEPCAHLCHCGTMICTGSMHLTKERYDAWEAFEDSIAKKTKIQRIRYHKDLPLLSSYPKIIEDSTIYTLFGNLEQKAIRLDDEEVPGLPELRKTIRESGKTIVLSKLKLHIFGIWDNMIISKPLDH